MRSYLIGLAMAAVLVAGLFALAHYYPPNLVATPQQSASDVQAGFTGRVSVGPWILSCQPGPSAPQAAIPFSFGAKGNVPAAASTRPGLGRCRTVLIFRRKSNPQQVVMIMTFGIANPGQRLAMIVRIPAVAKKGDSVIVAWGRAGLKLPVAACDARSCLAGGALADATSAQFLTAQRAALVLTVGPQNKPVQIPVPMTGLPQAVAAMRRAEG